MCKDNNMGNFDFSRALDRVQEEQDYYEEERISSTLRHKGEGYNRGEEHGSAILTENSIREIRELIKTIPRKLVAKQYGVSRKTIDAIATRRRWGHVK